MPKVAKPGSALCPSCRQPSSVDAVICPHCGMTFTQAQIDARKQADASAVPTPKDDKKAMTVGCIGLVVAILLLATCIGGGGDKADSTSNAGAAAAPGDAKKDVITTYKAVISATASCDAASSTMASVLQGGDLVAAYRAAEHAENACLGTGSEIRGIDVPDSMSGEHRTSLKDALEACDTAYVMKWSGARKLKDIIDGDSSPSALADLQETTETMQQGQMLCVGGIVAIATSLGATEADLGLAAAGKKAEPKK